MKVQLQLDEHESQRLVELATILQVDPHELAKAAIRDLTAHRDDSFQRAANRVLEKNQELYRRLG